MVSVKKYKCPKCGIQLTERVKLYKDTRWFVCPGCNTDFYKIEGMNSLIEGPIDGYTEQAKVDSLYDATCICNRCGCMYNEELPMPMFREWDIKTNEWEAYKGCYTCKTDAYLMDVNLSVTPHIRSSNRKITKKMRKVKR